MLAPKASLLSRSIQFLTLQVTTDRFLFSYLYSLSNTCIQAILSFTFRSLYFLLPAFCAGDAIFTFSGPAFTCVSDFNELPLHLVT